MADVLQEFKSQCESALQSAVDKAHPGWKGALPRLTVPPNPEFGELSSSIAYEIAKEKGKAPSEVASSIQKSIELQTDSLISGVEESSGYVNFRLNYKIAAARILRDALKADNYGVERTQNPIRVAVEHTSANPSGPLTMGHARNAILGDSLARLLGARGHEVKRRFYVDDVGRQVSILAFGFRLLNEPEPLGKVDHWLGALYACTNCIVQLETLKKKLKSLQSDEVNLEQRTQTQKELDEWVGIASELESTQKDLFAKVANAAREREDPEAEVQELGRKYEAKDPETVRLVRNVSELSLDGIRKTLHELDIKFDVWDWESDTVWSGEVEQVLSKAKQLPFTHTEGASAFMDVNAIVDAYSLRKAFGLSSTYEVTPLTLVRSDGTTLYPTRDIAYSLMKFKESQRVVNVIAIEQTLPQLQIRLALYALGEKAAATNLIHYAYGLVELPGMKMSKRRYHYVALDDVIQQAKGKVTEIVSRRKEEFTESEQARVAESVAVGAIKFAMLNVSSSKNLTFTWDRVLSLERNSAPFVNYAYTRAGSILRKMGQVPQTWDASLLIEPLEKLLILKVGQLPRIFVEAADQLKPEDLAMYGNALAEKFHEYYEKVDVIHASEPVKNARACLVRAVQIALKNSMTLLGINLTERM